LRLIVIVRNALLFVLIFLFTLKGAVALDYFNVTDFAATISFSGSVELIASGDFDVQNLSLVLRALPQEGNFTFTSSQAVMQGEFEENQVLYFNYSELREGFEYVVTLNYTTLLEPVFFSEIELLNDTLYSEELASYTEFDEFTTPDPVVREKASTLVLGNRTRLDAVLAVMDFVHAYITYDLSVGDDLKNVSWVWENRIGTCDEYSVLAVSMLRALNIPARFVHGYVYSGETNDFGPHSWVEVFVGGQWMPFDPTYGQYGVVDVTHIAFSKTKSARFEQVSISYLQRNARLDASRPTVSIVPTRAEQGSTGFTLSAALDKQKYYENDYALLTMDVSSPQSRYTLLPLQITTTSAIQRIRNVSAILVEGMTERAYELLKTGQTPNKQTYLIHPVRVRTPFSPDVSLELEHYPGSAQSTLEQALAQIPSQNATPYADVSVTLFYEPVVYGTQMTVEMALTNTGNQELDDMRISANEPRVMVDAGTLFVNEKKNVTLALVFDLFGEKNVPLNITYGNTVLGVFFVSVLLVEKPNLSISYDYTKQDGAHSVSVEVTDVHNASHNASISLAAQNYYERVHKSNYTFIIPDRAIDTDIIIEATAFDTQNQSHSIREIIFVERTLLERVWLALVRFLSALLA